MPKIKVHSFQLTNNRFTPYRGKLNLQQDSFFVGPGSSRRLAPIAGVFDGHGENGHQISRASAQALANIPSPPLDIRTFLSQLPSAIENVARTALDKELETAILVTEKSAKGDPKAFYDVGDCYGKDIYKQSGSTMTALFWEEKNQSMWVSNLGDSRAACYSGSEKPLAVWKRNDAFVPAGRPVQPFFVCTTDHAFGKGKDDLKDGQTRAWWDQERAELEKLGSPIYRNGRFWRVKGDLMLSRSLFDERFQLIKNADVYEIPMRTIKKALFVVASDGVSDVLTPAEIGTILYDPLSVLIVKSGILSTVKDMLKAVAGSNSNGYYTKEQEQAIEICITSIQEGFGSLEDWEKSPIWNNLDNAAQFIAAFARVLGSEDDATCQIIDVNLE